MRAPPHQGPHGGPVGDERIDALRMKEQAHEIMLVAADAGPDVLTEHGSQEIERLVRHSHIPGAIKGDRRERLVRRQHHANGRQNLAHLRVFERAGAEERGKTRGCEPGIAIPKGHVERLAQLQDHVPTGIGATRFQETDVALGDA